MTTPLPLARLERGLTRLRNDHPGLKLQHLLALIWLTRNEGANITDLHAYLGVSSPSGTRAVARLGSGTLRITGLGLLREEEDPRDRRAVQLYLTPKGKSLLRELERHLEA